MTISAVAFSTIYVSCLCTVWSLLLQELPEGAFLCPDFPPSVLINY